MKLQGTEERCQEINAWDMVLQAQHGTCKEQFTKDQLRDFEQGWQLIAIHMILNAPIPAESDALNALDHSSLVLLPDFLHSCYVIADITTEKVFFYRVTLQRRSLGIIFEVPLSVSV
jgi:hypothetical protein